jgi:hypothetical protein
MSYYCWIERNLKKKSLENCYYSNSTGLNLKSLKIMNSMMKNLTAKSYYCSNLN